MSSLNSLESGERISHVLGSLREKGIRLWSENGELRFRAPKGALTPEEIERLKRSRSALVALLERRQRTDPGDSTHSARSPVSWVPITFSQLAHWRAYRLDERPAIRQIASATRVRGTLSLLALQRSLTRVVARHSALRTRIISHDGVLVQEVAERGDCLIREADLTHLPAGLQHSEVQHLIDQLLLEPVELAAGPLMAAQLVKLSRNEHVLIVALEHTISDARSMDILLQELFQGYGASTDADAKLPEVTAQFADYAIWQKNAHAAWLQNHDAYWRERAARWPRVRFPSDRLDTNAKGWDVAHVHINRELKAQLREWCRVHQTTIAMTVYAAYVALVARWCKASEVVTLYITDGRTDSRFENTIGYLAATLYVRVKLAPEDRFVDLLAKLTNAYCMAYARADSFYLEAQEPRAAFTRNSTFNWVPQGAQAFSFGEDAPTGPLEASVIHFDHPMLNGLERDTEPFIQLFDHEDEITGGVGFPRSRFSQAMMDHFAECLMRVIRVPLEDTHQPVLKITLPAPAAENDMALDASPSAHRCASGS